jgi:hypothetical protein
MRARLTLLAAAALLATPAMAQDKIIFATEDNVFGIRRPGVNFINVLRTAFTLVGPKSVKRY